MTDICNKYTQRIHKLLDKKKNNVKSFTRYE